jgi:hypothetical protein
MTAALLPSVSAASAAEFKVLSGNGLKAAAKSVIAPLFGAEQR